MRAAEVRELEECLHGLMAVLPQEPIRAREAIRGLLARDRDGFLAAALPLLKGAEDSPGVQYLFVLLLANHLLPPCNPRLLSLEDEISIARRVKCTDPLLDLKLARRFSMAARTPGTLDADTASRILEVLASIANHNRILPMLVQLLGHPNARLRSKVALMMARCNRSAEWVEQMLSESDARVRANAVEALWGLDTEAARKLFRRACADENNRVVGNALIGLYRIGDPGAVRSLFEMSAHEQAPFRSTAAWAMGETEDPRFLPRLARMVRESDNKVRHSVFRAIGRISRAVAGIKRQPRLGVHAVHAMDQPDGARLLRVAIAADKDQSAGLPATAFVLEENGRLVLDYTVQKQRSPVSLAVGLALPTAREPHQDCDEHIAAALESCLAGKRSTDRWAILRFAAGPQPAAALPSTHSMLTSDANALRRNAASAAVIRPGSLDALQLLVSALAAGNGARHLLLVQDWRSEPAWSESDGQAWQALAKLAQVSSIALHMVALRSTAPAAALEALATVCPASGGLLLTAGSPDQLPALCAKLCASLLHAYEISYRPEAGSLSGEIRLQVYSPRGFGEDTLRT